MSNTASPPLNLKLYLGLPLCIALALIALEWTDLDMFLARLAYDPAIGFIGRRSYFLEDILHDRAKQGLIVLGLLTVVAFIASSKVQRLMPWRRELGCLVLSVALCSSFVTPLKQLTQVQCPWSLQEFGGDQVYSKLLEPRPPTDKAGLCWPGGHATSGFTWFALFFVLRDRRPRAAKAALALAFGLGVLFSVGRMLQGAHFLSHNVWTAVFCWLICLGCYRWILYRPQVRDVDAQPALT